MQHAVKSASDIAGAIRAARKAQKLCQNDAAGSVGVSESFMVKVERGAGRVQWGKLFHILEGLGIRVFVDIPEASPERLSHKSAATAQGEQKPINDGSHTPRRHRRAEHHTLNENQNIWVGRKRQRILAITHIAVVFC